MPSNDAKAHPTYLITELVPLSLRTVGSCAYAEMEKDHRQIIVKSFYKHRVTR